MIFLIHLLLYARFLSTLVALAGAASFFAAVAMPLIVPITVLLAGAVFLTTVPLLLVSEALFLVGGLTGEAGRVIASADLAATLAGLRGNEREFADRGDSTAVGAAARVARDIGRVAGAGAGAFRTRFFG